MLLSDEIARRRTFAIISHPDAGKIWSFGNYKQAITDATLYRSEQASVRLIVGSQVLGYTADATTDGQLWVPERECGVAAPASPLA